MLPSVFIAAALASQGGAVSPHSYTAQPIVVTESRLRDLADLYRPVLRPLPPELLKLVPPPARSPTVEPAPKK